MKNLHNKEKQFAEILSDLNFDVNTDEVWDAIEHRLPQESPSRKWLFWKMGGLGMLIMLPFLGYKYVLDTDAHLSMDRQTAEESSLISVDDNVVFQKSAALEAAIEKVSSVAQGTRAQDDASTIIPSAIVQKENSTELNKKHRSSISSVGVQDKSESSMSSSPSLLMRNKALDKVVDEKTTLPVNDKISNYQVESSSRNQISTLGILDHLLPSSLAIGERDFSPVLPSVEVLRSPLSLYWSIGAGVNFNMPHYFTNPSETISQSSLGQLESTLPGATLSMSVGLESDKGWRFFGGLRYNQLVNLYSNQNFNSNSELVDGIESLSLDENGGSTPISGQVEQQTIRQNDINWHRQFHNIDVMAGVGKRILNINKWSIAAEAMVVLNTFSASSGYVFTNDFNSINKFPQEIDNPFETMGLGTAFSLQIERDLNKSFTVFCAPSYSKYYKRLNSDSFYTTNNSQLGLQFGLKYWPRG